MTLAGELSNADGCKVLFTPKETRHRQDDVLFESSIGSQFGDKAAMQPAERVGSSPGRTAVAL